jgi:uracil-DNA glycosylase family 4
MTRERAAEPRRAGAGRNAVEREWGRLERDIVECQRCPRLVAHCREVASVRRRAFRDETYWGRPVPGFGDRKARLLVFGLAPAAHGANRTGRMFTGDRSGAWLYGALHRAGRATQPTADRRDDGLALVETFVSAACRCAPPGNRPDPGELARCSLFLERELELLGESLRAVLALGRIAWDALIRRALATSPGDVPRPRPAFAHLAETRLPLVPGRPPLHVVGSYHPSQQNTQTGRLTRAMLDAAVARAIRHCTDAIVR